MIKIVQATNIDDKLSECSEKEKNTILKKCI